MCMEYAPRRTKVLNIKYDVLTSQTIYPLSSRLETEKFNFTCTYYYNTKKKINKINNIFIYSERN